VTAPVLEVRDLTVRHGQVAAVRRASLAVERGRIAAVVGPNGAGKTTLLGAIAGLLVPAAGEVRLSGSPLAPGAVEENVARGLSLVPETRELFPGLSIDDHLALGAFVHRRRGRAAREETRAEVFQLFPRLAERRRQLAATLSGGERQMLALGRALMARPRVLLLDEPSLGLAPRVVREILEAVSRLRDRGVAVLLVEQNARAALAVADEAWVLEAGDVVLSGPAAEVARDERVVASYLGA
jgi:branched-chain amino acid transport system ATP-binding protein